MQKETKQCQNCKKNFTLEADDFSFFEKMKVPPPTFCSDCLFQARLIFRNDRNLYRRKSDNDGTEIISMYSKDKPLKIYARDYWWSDKWDSLEYGREYDFSKPFFEQFKKLILDVPWPSFFNWNSANSDFCNFSTDNKNCYLIFGSDFNENTSYCKYSFHCKDSSDLYWVDKAELSYENVDCENIYKVLFSAYSDNCASSSFLYNCSNCQNCLGCVNLKNKSYCIFNEQYAKEEYEKKIKEFNLNNYPDLEEFKKRFEKFRTGFPNRFARIIRSINCTGNNIFNSKNCLICFDVHDSSEDCKNVFLTGWNAKDIYFSSHVGYQTELVYNSIGVFSGAQNVKCSAYVPTCTRVSYSYNCKSSSDLFGCAGLKNMQYCILNKQYTKEEYEALLPKIIKHMDDMPYADKKRRVYKYGDFFPAELSPFGYNETEAHEYVPLTEEDAKNSGFFWKNPEERNYLVTKRTEDLPGKIGDTLDSTPAEVIACAHDGKCNEQCTSAFKITKSEFDFYRRIDIPLPRLCHNCRHYARLLKRNPYKLWHRKCQCAGAKSENGIYGNQTKHNHGSEHCPNEFETSYAPERPEIVYCENCYNSEVA